MEYPLTRNFLQQMSRDELREQCRKLNYRVNGFKDELVDRILTGDTRPLPLAPKNCPRPQLIKTKLNDPTLDTDYNSNINYYLLSSSLIVVIILFLSSF